MIGHLIVLGVLWAGEVGLHGADAVAAAETAADRLMLRDGKVVWGLVTSATAGPRGSVEILVRRDWAQTQLGDHLRRWDRSTAAMTRMAVQQRRKRVADWRRERAASVGPDDRILAWIDGELGRLADPEMGGRSTLLSVRVPGIEVRDLERRPAAIEHLLRLAWIIHLPEPETMPLEEVKGALEARGYAADVAGRSSAVALDHLLPPSPEPEATWRARRAATEVMIDSELRFLRYQNMVIPDASAGGPVALSAVTFRSALAELNWLLDPNSGKEDRVDPLRDPLAAIGASGRVGAVVTRLAIATDLSGVTVEVTLWVRDAGGHWVPFRRRAATVQAEELRPEVGRPIAEDPQVQGAFRIIEGLGLGSIPLDLKVRSLRIGAATQQALETARSTFRADLDALVLPVLEPPRPRDPDLPGAAGAEPQPAPRPIRPRRSVLGPPDR